MTAEFHSFRRLVLGLQPRAADPGMRFAVELAELLQLDLLGLFVEESGLHDLAAIPFAREFWPLGGGWHPMDTNRLAREFELAALACERLFRAAAKSLTTDCRFEVVRGPIVESLAGISQFDDIIVIIEPVNPAERATQQFLWQIEAAFRSAAAVLLVPPRIERRAGPVVAIAGAPGDPAIPAAAAIARAAKEQVVIVAADGDALGAEPTTGKAGTSIEAAHVAIGREALTSASFLCQALPPLGERLLVVSRGLLTDAVAVSIASLRRIPLLVIEPGEFNVSSRQPQKNDAA